MEKKLEYTQEILRGLATGDLKDVAENGEQMRLLSKVEGWIRNRKPGYRAQFQAFEFANAEIVRNANADNLDGAAMAFQQLTISCVSCHKILRDVQ
jgi:cytochrome c556